MITVDGVKMGKSLGNAITIKEMLAQHNAMTIRFFVQSSHYRSPTDFSEDALQASARGLERLTSTVNLVHNRLRTAAAGEVDADWLAKLEDYRARFEEAMDDDFNAPRAIATLFDLGREVNTLLNSGEPVSLETLEAIDSLYAILGGDVLGITFGELVDSGGASQAERELVDSLVHMLIDIRQEARHAKDWAKADSVRDQLASIGITLEDGPDGTRWRLGQ
jgi:cysteinyl-tRNA synthetase